MKILQKCGLCKKRVLIIKKRSHNFIHLPIGNITSEKEICKKCHKNMITMVLSTNPIE